MPLTPEWKSRINRWIREMPRQFYRPIGRVELAGFIGPESLSPAQAAKKEFTPMPEGSSWGGKWEYGWFRGSLVVPEEAKGQRICLDLKVGGAGTLIWVDGRLHSARDNSPRDLCLCPEARGGETFEILAEVYADHGPRVCSTGPVPLDRQSVPEPPSAQQKIGATTFGRWVEDAYQLWLDAQTLMEIAEANDPDSLRVSRIETALQEMTCVVDFELPVEEMIETFRTGRQVLEPLMACTNGSSAPVMYSFGHGHLDVAWLWPLAETQRKAARTLANQLKLAESYPGYRFLHSQPHLFRMVERRYPELFEQVVRAVEDGRIIADGGSWIEMDTNITGGESLIRQFLHGKRYLAEKFGVDSKMLWLPDVFGYSAALPQILRGCGVDYFATAKIFWNYPGGETFPHNTFRWEGVDGTDVGVHLMNNYNAQTWPSHVIGRWKERVQKHGIAERLYPFGWGDGGGGPERDHLEVALRQENLEGSPKMKLASPQEFFEHLDANGWPEIRYVGELYFQAHRGVFTTQAKTKKGNRKSELALRDAELWASIARAAKGFDFGPAQLDEAWKTVLLNQFHDILPGSSIARVYQEAEASYAQVIEQAGQVRSGAQAALVQKSEAITLFNSLSWKRYSLTQLPEDWAGASDSEGDALCCQDIEGRRYVEPILPACGWTTLTPADNPRLPCSDGTCVEATDNSLENQHLRLELNDRGEIVSLYDKDAGRQLADRPVNAFKMYKDVPSKFDAWDIDSMYEKTPVALDAPADSIEKVTHGGLVGIVRIKRKLHNSQLTQEIRLHRRSRRIDFVTRIDWDEHHKLLKVNFPVNIHADHAIHEIQMAHVTRPNHKSRQYDADRFEVPQQKWTALAEADAGVAILNDCKYGCNVSGNSINLTLLKSAKAPDMHADIGTQEFNYSLYAWNGSLAASGVARQAYEINVPATTAAGNGGQQSVFTIDDPDVILETLKPAEDGSSDIVLRLYESMRRHARTSLHTTLPVSAAEQTNMLETDPQPLDVHHDGRIDLQFRPFEIKTLRLKL
ncbi:MAG: alpha-mannosidase [Phycisphaerae bacterium]